MEKLNSILEMPRVAVVTPYFKEDIQILSACHQSVLHQILPCLHVLVADGFPRSEVDGWNAHHITLPVSHADIGSTPRLIGSYHAIGLGVDAVAFLDADNSYDPYHIASMIDACKSHDASIVSTGRMLCRLDGSLMAPCPLTDPNCFIDTNCMLFARAAFHLLHHWVLMPDYGHLIGDRIMLHHIRKSGLKHVHLPTPSVNYRCGKEGLYRLLGEPAPQGVAPRPNYEASFQRWIEDGHESLR